MIYVLVAAVLSLLSIITIKVLAQRDMVAAAEASRLTGEAHYAHARAEHEEAQARHVREQSFTQECNTSIGRLQIEMQRNTLRLQTAQVAHEIATKLVAPAPN